jgi:hypothetical protein
LLDAARVITVEVVDQQRVQVEVMVDSLVLFMFVVLVGHVPLLEFQLLALKLLLSAMQRVDRLLEVLLRHQVHHQCLQLCVEMGRLMLVSNVRSWLIFVLMEIVATQKHVSARPQKKNLKGLRLHQMPLLIRVPPLLQLPLTNLV